MSQPSSRGELIDYCKRQLGAPVLEINLATEQCDDLIDDAIQYFQERHFDGVSQMFLKYQVTEEDIDRGRAPHKTSVGIVTTTATGLLSEGRYVYNVLVSSGTTIYNIANGNVLVYAGISSAP